MRGFSLGMREAQHIHVVLLLPQPLFGDRRNGYWQTRTSLLLSLLHTSSPQMTLYGNTHTPVGVIATACVTTVVVFTWMCYVSYMNANIFFIEPNSFSALFIIKHQPSHILPWTQHPPWEICVPRGVMLQSGSIYNNHNQINASKYVSWAEQAWR